MWRKFYQACNVILAKGILIEGDRIFYVNVICILCNLDWFPLVCEILTSKCEIRERSVWFYVLSRWDQNLPGNIHLNIHHKSCYILYYIIYIIIHIDIKKYFHARLTSKLAAQQKCWIICPDSISPIIRFLDNFCGFPSKIPAGDDLILCTPGLTFQIEQLNYNSHHFPFMK